MADGRARCGSETMIAVIEYGMGNQGSIVNALRRIGVPSIVTSTREEIQTATGLVLPGVGSFGKGMANLERAGLVSALEERVLDEGVPILGICLGMQIFGERSEEGGVEGLGWLPAETIRFRLETSGSRIKIPHMGWNGICANGDPLLTGITGEDLFYFAHSYHLTEIDPGHVIGTTEYGYTFPSAVRRANIWGIQCHIERSHGSGLRVLRNFAGLC